MSIIKLNNIEKAFGENLVLKGLNLEISKGEIFGFLGHNGAGKTTTLRIILGLLNIENGSVEILGKDPFNCNEDVRKRCGVLSEENGLYESLTVYENLKFFAEAYKCFDDKFEEKIDYLLKKFEILDKKHEVIKDFSLGMKKKTAIVRTLFHEPEIVLLDEPTNGLDPISVNTFIEIIKEMSEKKGTTFVLTTHNLDVVNRVCDRVVIVKNGKNAYDKNLKNDENTDLVKTEICYMDGDVQKIDGVIKKIDSTLSFEIDENKKAMTVETNDKTLVSEIVKQLIMSGFSIYNVNMNTFDLNQIYTRIDSEVI